MFSFVNFAEEMEMKEMKEMEVEMKTKMLRERGGKESISCSDAATTLCHTVPDCATASTVPSSPFFDPFLTH